MFEKEIQTREKNKYEKQKMGKQKQRLRQTPTFFFPILELMILGHNVFFVLLLLSILLYFFDVPKKKNNNSCFGISDCT